jgi:hypothetical protein
MINKDLKPVIEQESGYAIQDSYIDEARPMHVAGLGNAFIKLFPKKYYGERRTQDIFEDFNTKKPDAPEVTPEMLDEALQPPKAPEGPPPEPVETGMTGATSEGDIPPSTDELLETYQQTEVPTEKRTDQRNINIERHAEGALADPDRTLEQAETADDIARLLEASAEVQDLGKTTRTFGELEERTATPELAMAELEGVFGADATVTGNLSDVQLLATRRMLTTLGEQTVALANRIAAGDQTTETLLQYQKKGEAFMALQGFLQNKVTEAARALAQQRIIAKSLEGNNLNALTDYIQIGAGPRSPEDIARHAQNLVQSTKNKGIDQGMVDQWKPQPADYFKAGVEYWVNNMLSGVETHVVNMIGTPIVALYENVVRLGAVGIGQAREALSDVPVADRVRMEESSAKFLSGFMALRDSSDAFIDAIKSGQSQFGAEKGEEVRGNMKKVFGYHFGKGGELAADVGTLSFRALGAEDSFWKVGVFRSEFTALAIRDAYAKGLDVNDHVKEVLDNPQNYPELYEQAINTAKKYTFTESDRPGIIGDMSRFAKRAASAHPYLKVIMPFIETPANLIHYASEMSALAPLSKSLRDEYAAGGARRDVAISKMMVGTATSVSAYMAYQAGMATGGGPSEYPRRLTFERLGVGEHAITVGDEQYVVKRLDPIQMSFFAVIDAFQRADYARTDEDFTTQLLQSSLMIANNAMGATWMTGFKDFLDMIEGRKNIKDWATSAGVNLVPYAGTMRTIEKITDPDLERVSKDRNVESDWPTLFLQKLERLQPGEKGDFRPPRYWDGTIVHPKGGKPASEMDLTDRVVAATLPVYSTGEMRRHAPTEALIQNGIGPVEPSPMITTAGVTWSILSLGNGDGVLYDKYIKRVGEYREQLVAELIKDKNFKKLDAGPGSTQAAQLQRMLAKGKEAGLAAFLTEDLKEFIALYPEKANEFAQVVGISYDRFIRQAQSETLPPEMQDKIKVRGKSDTGGLPLPPHAQEEMPRF